MKTLATLGMVMSLTLKLCAEPLLTDIATFEVLVIDEATGATLATGGPWIWEPISVNDVSGPIAGPGRTIVVKCRNAAGATIFGGVLTGLDLSVAPSPFDPPNPSGEATLTFYGENDTFAIFLNHNSYVSGLILMPAEDDPPPFIAVTIDIKPGSTVNPFNTTSRGVLPVALLGSADLDVNQVDPASITLAGLSPVRHTIEDIQQDGFADVILHFPDQGLAGLLADTANGAVVALELTGRLADGTALKGSDSVTVIRKPNKR